MKVLARMWTPWSPIMDADHSTTRHTPAGIPRKIYTSAIKPAQTDREVLFLITSRFRPIRRIAELPSFGFETAPQFISNRSDQYRPGLARFRVRLDAFEAVYDVHGRFAKTFPGIGFETGLPQECVFSAAFSEFLQHAIESRSIIQVLHEIVQGSIQEPSVISESSDRIVGSSENGQKCGLVKRIFNFRLVIDELLQDLLRRAFSVMFFEMTPTDLDGLFLAVGQHEDGSKRAFAGRIVLIRRFTIGRFDSDRSRRGHISRQCSGIVVGERCGWRPSTELMRSASGCQ